MSDIEVKKMGRPCAVTDDIKLKLDMAFGIGCTNREACAYAGVTEESFYRFIRRFPDYKRDIDDMKLKPILKARNTVHANLDDPHLAWQYLQKRRPDEFTNKLTIESSGEMLTQEDAIKFLKESEE